MEHNSIPKDESPPKDDEPTFQEKVNTLIKAGINIKGRKAHTIRFLYRQFINDRPTEGIVSGTVYSRARIPVYDIDLDTVKGWAGDDWTGWIGESNKWTKDKVHALLAGIPTITDWNNEGEVALRRWCDFNKKLWDETGIPIVTTPELAGF